MRILDFPIVKFTIFLIAGILIGYYLNPSIQDITYGVVLLLVVLLGLLIYLRHKFNQTILFGTVSSILMLGLGAFAFQIHNERNYENHYIHNQEIGNEDIQLVFSIDNILKPTVYHNKYVVELLKLNGKASNGKLLLNIVKDSIADNLKVGDTYYSHSKLETIRPPFNPGQFNYGAYLEKQYIYNQVFATNDDLHFIENNSSSLKAMAFNIREGIISKLEKQNFKPDQLAIFKALLLGQRTDISRETYNNYVNAGAVHILAVSGLHVGIILMILQVILRPLDYLRHGRILRMVFIIILLWIFAIVAGLSPSVTRAVAMFTAVVIALNLKSIVNIYNTLAISVFFLLLFKPMFLFDVGFQLSYVAVIAIVALQPLFYKLLNFNNKILDYFWQLFTVTLAAQIGVLPIGLYYFHQFPALFFISNLAIIPILGFVLGLGILIIFLSVINLIPTFLVKIFGGLIDIMNYIVEWVSKKEDFLFQDVAFSFWQLIAAYTFIILLTQLFISKKAKYLQYTLGLIILFQAGLFIKATKTTHEFIVFHKTRETYLGKRINEDLNIFTNRNSFDLKQLKFLRDYKVEHHISDLNVFDLKNIIPINEDHLLIIDSAGVYNLEAFKPSYVLLKDSPSVNLSRLIDSIQPQLIIADGSNYKSYVQRWKATSKKMKIPFHATAEKGSYTINLTLKRYLYSTEFTYW